MINIRKSRIDYTEFMLKAIIIWKIDFESGEVIVKGGGYPDMSIRIYYTRMYVFLMDLE